MSGPGFDVASLLAERHPASVSTVTSSGSPALALMWFEATDGRLWFHTPALGGRPNPFLAAAERSRDVAAMIATFDPPDDVRQLRTTGPARIEPADHVRVRRIYERYVDHWTNDWETQATSADYQLWSLMPQRGMAVSFPNLEGGTPFRWTSPQDFFDQPVDRSPAP